MSDETPGRPPDQSFEERLKRARARTEDRRKAEAQRETASAMGVGFRLSVELVAGVFVGGVIGYLLDGLLGTSPWLLLVFFLAGAIAGVRNMLRAVEKMRSADEANDKKDEA